MRGIIAFFVIGIGAPVIVFALAVALAICPPSLRADIWEQLTNESPEAKVKAYVEAVARGDEQGALLVWELTDVRQLPAGWSFRSSEDRYKALSDRRQKVTSDLVAGGVRPDFTILSIEWWGTCCDPHLANNPRDAGAARVRVALHDRAGGQSVYVFDVITREYPYWAIDEYPPRAWVLRDVYPDKEDPLRFPYRSTPESAQPVTGAG